MGRLEGPFVGVVKARRLAEDPRPNLKSKSSSPKARPVQTTPFTERTSAGVQKTPQDSASAKKGSKQPDGKLTSQSGPLFTLHTIEKCELEKKVIRLSTAFLPLQTPSHNHQSPASAEKHASPLSAWMTCAA